MPVPTSPLEAASLPGKAEDFQVRPPDEAGAVALGEACKLGASAAQILLHRGFVDPVEATGFLEAGLRGLTVPDAMADRLVAADRLARAVSCRERVVVFGDYDVDGTTSALILSEILGSLGGEVRTLVADRFVGGYGLSAPALERCVGEQPRVLVTCDCGSSDHERIAEAANRGIDVVVVDHHLVPEEALPAMAFLNPNRADCGFSYKGMSSAGLALSLGAAVRAKLGARLDVRRWLDLVALGTVADVSPLDGDNRRLVRAGLKLLGSAHTRPALRALRRLVGLPDSAHLTTADIAFRLAPRINAPGRLGASELTLRWLQARGSAEVARLTDEVEEQNAERKRIAEHTVAEAMAQAKVVYGDAPLTGMVVGSEGWHRGVVGIVAARLVEEFQQPVAVVAFDGTSGHGSVRTTEGLDIYSALERCASELDAWGGHRAAAGLSMSRDRLEALRAAFADATRQEGRASRVPTQIDVRLGGAYRVPTIEDLDRLGPFGESFPTPLFLVEADIAEATAVGSSQAHAKLHLRLGDQRLRAFAPRLIHQLQDRPKAQLVGEFQPDHWIGDGSVELLVKDVIG